MWAEERREGFRITPVFKKDSCSFNSSATNPKPQLLGTIREVVKKDAMSNLKLIIKNKMPSISGQSMTKSGFQSATRNQFNPTDASPQARASFGALKNWKIPTSSLLLTVTQRERRSNLKNFAQRPSERAEPADNLEPNKNKSINQNPMRESKPDKKSSTQQTNLTEILSCRKKIFLKKEENTEKNFVQVKEKSVNSQHKALSMFQTHQNVERRREVQISVASIKKISMQKLDSEKNGSQKCLKSVKYLPLEGEKQRPKHKSSSCEMRKVSNSTENTREKVRQNIIELMDKQLARYILILGSDGFWDVLDKREIAVILENFV